MLVLAHRTSFPTPPALPRLSAWFIPELNGKLIGSAQRVPVPTGSTTILVAVVKGKDVTKESHQRCYEGSLHYLESFGYNEDQIVSSDVIGDDATALMFDATQTMVAKTSTTTDLSGSGRVLVRQRELLHLSDGPHHQVLREVRCLI